MLDYFSCWHYIELFVYWCKDSKENILNSFRPDQEVIVYLEITVSEEHDFC